MKQLQISSQEALKLYPNASVEIKTIFENTFGKDFFKQKITDQIQGWNDILAYFNVNENSFVPYRNPQTPEERSLNAQAKIFKIVQVYNKEVILDWKNTSRYKYFPYKYFSDGRWLVSCGGFCSHLFRPSGLHFKSEELALDAIKKFESIFDDYFMIN